MTCVESSSFPSTPRRTRSSMAERNAARVLPDPVGAAISVCRCFLISGHARSCGSVGAGKLRANQRATAGWKSSCCIGEMHYKARHKNHKEIRGFHPYDPCLLELFSELLELLFELLHFSREVVDLLLQTRASRRRTRRSYAFLFRERF